MRWSVILASMFLLSIWLASPAMAAPKKCSDCGHARNAATGQYERTNQTAVGFHVTQAPLGIRTHLSGNVNLDLGVGFSSRDSRDDLTLDGGLPIEGKKWSGARVLFRPGVCYSKHEKNGPDVKTTAISAEIEGEMFPVRNFSVSAALGVAHTSTDFGVGDDVNEWHATGGEFTRVGVHLYLWR